MKLREIAARLREAAAYAPPCDGGEAVRSKAGDWSIECNCDRERLQEFKFGTLVIRCRAGAAHIFAVAEKYEKGLRGRGFQLAPAWPTRPSLKRPAQGEYLLKELLKECGEELEEVAA